MPNQSDLYPEPIDLDHVPARARGSSRRDLQAAGFWPGQGRLLRGPGDTVYLVDADTEPSASVLALEGVSAELEAWLRTINPVWGIDRLLWDADSHGLDMDVVGVVLRQLSELGALQDPPKLRQNRPMRVALIGEIPEFYLEQFGDWSTSILAPWRRTGRTWGQTQTWDRVGELVEVLASSEVDLVISVTSSSVLDALDLSFLRNLRRLAIPHLCVATTQSRALVGPFVDFTPTNIKPRVAGVCSDCLAQAQLDGDPDWASLLAHLVFVAEQAVAPDMLRVALTEAGRWATNWWFQDRRIAKLHCGQLVVGRRDLEWDYVPLGASGSCQHPVGGI